MAVAFVKQGTASSAAASTSITVSLASAPATGSLLLLAMAGDKNTGVLTLTGWTKLYELLSTSVSLYYYYKVSDGSETSISPSWAAASTAGNMAWYGNLDDSLVTGSSWVVSGQASSITDETTVSTKTTGTTGTLSADGLGVAVAAVDSSQSITTVGAWGNSYSARYAGTGGGGRGGVFVGEKSETSGATTSSSFSYTGTADQVSAAIGVWTKQASGTNASVSATPAAATATSLAALELAYATPSAIATGAIVAPSVLAVRTRPFIDVVFRAP